MTIPTSKEATNTVPAALQAVTAVLRDAPDDTDAVNNAWRHLVASLTLRADEYDFSTRQKPVLETLAALKAANKPDEELFLRRIIEHLHPEDGINLFKIGRHLFSAGEIEQAQRYFNAARNALMNDHPYRDLPRLDWERTTLIECEEAIVSSHFRVQQPDFAFAALYALMRVRTKPNPSKDIATAVGIFRAKRWYELERAFTGDPDTSFSEGDM